jgi:glyoxylase-like metal-dependent hydrolase (beta-lactamase superfamily II)
MLQDLRASSIVLNADTPDSLFRIPETYAKLEPTPPTPTVTKLGTDVYGVMGFYNSIAAVFDEYVLVVEAGHSSGYADASIGKIKEIAPGKPIRYLVSTHFHFDHLGGVRSYIAEGATIVTTPSTKRVIEDIVLKSVRTRRPDRLSRNPQPAKIEPAANKRVFEDGNHRVEVYDIGPNPHCAEIIIVYFPKEKILYVADLLNTEGGRIVGTGGEDTVDFAAKIKKLGLDVEKIVSTHGRTATMADLTKALERRDEKRGAGN